MSEPLPPGWKWTTVGEVFEIIGGSTPRTDNPDYWDGDIPWLTPDDLSRYKGVFISEGRRSITASGFKSTSTQMLPENSVIFSSRAPIGYVAIAANPLCTNQGFKSLIVPIGVLSEYVYWYLQHATPAIQEMGSGTTFKEISKKRMAVVSFLLPPTNEQERIVDAIEEHFSRIDAVESAAQTALTKLDTLRQTVLTAAFSGRLVEPLNPAEPPTALPEDWYSTTLNEVMHDSLFLDGDWVETKDQDPSGSVRLIQLADIGEGCFRDRSDRWLNDQTANRLRCTFLKEGDVLIARMPDPIGRACLMPDIGGRSVTAVDVCILRPNPNRLSSHYLMWQLNSPAFRIRVEALQSGTTRKRISRKNLATIPILLPPPAEQKRIVAAIEEHFSRIDAAEATLERCLQRCDVLRRSVLAAAFSGRLVDQDPNDEPASVLLERIAAEQPRRRTRKKSA